MWAPRNTLEFSQLGNQTVFYLELGLLDISLISS